MATTTLPNAPSSSATLSQKNVQLPDPFEVTESYILDKTYVTHVSDDEKCDTKILYDLVSNIITGGSTQISAATAGMGAESRVTAVINLKPEFPILKLISVQMIATRNARHCVHQTTLWILQHLRSYSWDAKALITLAAFALEYGNLVYLSRLQTTDALANSLKQLNQVQSRDVPTEITRLSLTMVQDVLQQIREWATLNDDVYDSDDVPSLSEAFQVIPLVVYWTIATIVASTGNLVGLSDYKLSEFLEKKLSPATLILRNRLELSKQEIGRVKDYWKRKKAFENPKGNIVNLVNALINPNGNSTIIYDGSTQKIMDIDQAFKQKYVLLFISGLNRIDDEISLLNSIYDRLQENPEEEIKGGYKKEDFKILWVPVVDKWDQISKTHFRDRKDKIKFYLVENNFSPLPGVRLIKEALKFEGDPIIPVYRPQGTQLNNDALGLIFEWGIDAFPFRKEDGDLLTQKWKWFWDVIKKLNPGMQVKGNRYIFIYGGNNKRWIQDITREVEKLKKHDTIKEADVIIDHFQVGKDDAEIVPRFWIGIESKKPKKHQDTLDCEVVKSMLCLKRDPQGWAILTKGSNIKVLGHGEPMYNTLAEFDAWKDKVLQKEGFDIAFKEYYDIKAKDYEAHQPCEYINDDTAASNVIATITCPNPTCGRVMEVTSVKFRCCHGHVSNI